MLVDGQPDLHGIVCVLPIDLVQVKAVVHALFYLCDVLEVADIEPVVKHALHPALAVKQVEANLTAQELCDKEVSLPLQVLDNASVHLREKLVE